MMPMPEPVAITLMRVPGAVLIDTKPRNKDQRDAGDQAAAAMQPR
jgi:hypothetical protein